MSRMYVAFADCLVPTKHRTLFAGRESNRLGRPMCTSPANPPNASEPMLCCQTANVHRS